MARVIPRLSNRDDFKIRYKKSGESGILFYIAVKVAD